jgi:hypothetical protein
MPQKPHRPSHEQRQTVLYLSAGLVGGKITKQAIANYLGITYPTLMKYYSEELEKGQTELFLKATQALEILIAENHPGTVKFVLESIGGLVPMQKVEHSGGIAVGKPVDAPEPPEDFDEWLARHRPADN